MKKSKYSDAQIMSILKQAEGGVPVGDLCREHWMSSASFYKWRSKYGGMDASLMARMKELDEENKRLKRMYAEGATECQRCRHIPADYSARQHAELAAEAADQVPDLPAFMGERPVQPRRAVFARRLAGLAGFATLAESVAPAEGPLGESAETFFSCSSSRPLET